MESSGEDEWESKISEKDFRRLSACNSSGDLSVDLKSPIIKAIPVKNPPKFDFVFLNCLFLGNRRGFELQ